METWVLIMFLTSTEHLRDVVFEGRAQIVESFTADSGNTMGGKPYAWAQCERRREAILMDVNMGKSLIDRHIGFNEFSKHIALYCAKLPSSD